MTNSPPVTVFSLPDADPQPGLVLNTDCELLLLNRAARELIVRNGLTDALDLLPVNTCALVMSALNQNRAIEGVEARVGETILLWAFIPDPQTGQLLVRGRDATEDVRMREEATRSNRLYRLITENTTDLISRHAPDGRFIDATPASWRLLGYWPEELRGKSLAGIFKGNSVTRKLTETRNRLRDYGYATMTVDIIHRDGTRRWFEIASRAIRETYTGAVIEVVSVSRDITGRVESEESNRRLADELAHAARLATLGELASGIAHEMNQPLATIVNFASASQRYLKNARTNPECLNRVDDGLQKIVHHANRASEVIKRLRAFLRKGHKRTAPVSLNDVVANVARLCQWEADKNGVRITQRLARCAPVITADPVLLEQVLINLIRNGIEANVEARDRHAGDTPSSVVISTCVNTAGETLIEVSDQGTGLDDRGIRQMFQPFYTSKPQGLGLGLSMSRSIIEGFGGFLDATPARSGGLTLICRFPPTTCTQSNAAPRTETQPDD
ncbi:PAS domain S-box protein [Marinobacter sp. M216]|uniref:histidine kinase n=1 Tax=Marinobacter albus TaxID=3030833 RepID=A0ABT7HHQ7_9GAMM|nr:MULTISPECIES: PAS domain S-box protein [unclassified Marinobacter]MBW7472536.1 PAS domain S-box protein [Marinobacter sp. F4218]MDK9559086.1 PAS domain S-box protein [Marinobacter sp. M216]